MSQYQFGANVNAGAAASGLTITLAFTCATGDTVVIHGSYGSATTIARTTMGDGTNTYLQQGTEFNGSGDSQFEYKADNVVGGSYTFTFTLASNAAFRLLSITTYRNLQSGTAPAALSEPSPGTGTDAVTSANMTPTAASSVVIGLAVATSGSVTLTKGTGFTDRGALANADTALGNISRLEDKRVTTTAGVPVTWTTNTAGVVTFVMGMVLGEQPDGPLPNSRPFALRSAGGALAIGLVAPQIPTVGSAGSTFSGTVAESLAFADGQTGQVDFSVARAESIAFADAQTAQVDFVVAEAESIAFTDAQTGATSYAPVQRDESIAFADGQTATLTVNGATAESIAFADGQTVAATFAGTTAESIAFTDSQSVQAVFAVTEAESIAFSDSQTASAVFASQRDEAIAFADSQDATLIPGGSNQVSESIAFVDAQSAQAVFAATVTESIGFVDAQVAQGPPDAAIGGTYGLWDFAEKKRKKRLEEEPPAIVEDLARVVAATEPPQQTEAAIRAAQPKFTDLSMGVVKAAQARDAEMKRLIAQISDDDDEDDIAALLLLL